MMLYHGTTKKYLPSIRERGILPRKELKNRGNWNQTVTSNKEAVYLTTTYPWHFAISASKTGQSGLILEIDQTKLYDPLLCPDEDFLEQGSRGQGPSGNNHLAPTDWSMKQRTKFYRGIAKFNPQLAEVSLNNMGTAAYYGSIPWLAVTRFVTIDWAKLEFSMRIRASDSQISIINHQILKNRHQAFTRWLFGDPVTAGELSGNALIKDQAAADPKFLDLINAQDEVVAKAMEDRSTIQRTQPSINCSKMGTSSQLVIKSIDF